MPHPLSPFPIGEGERDQAEAFTGDEVAEIAAVSLIGCGDEYERFRVVRTDRRGHSNK
jgi:hypothetical protein